MVICLIGRQEHFNQVLCLIIGKLLCVTSVEMRAILLEVVHSLRRGLQLRETSFLGEEALPPKELIRADTCTSFNPMISIFNPSSSFSIAAPINKVPVTFLLDTGSSIMIFE